MDPDEEPCPIDPRGNPAVPCPLASPAVAVSGTETRQRRRAVVVRLSDDEHGRVRALAAGSGQSVAALLRATLLSMPLPRRRRPRGDQAALAALLGELQVVAAELGKQGSNLNQLAHQANADRMPAGFTADLAAALEAHEEQARTLLELRDVCLRALGFGDADD